MKNNKEVKISFWANHLTTVVSVTLVLILIGIISLITIGATNETKRLREKLEVSVVMADSVSDAGAKALAKKIAAEPYAGNVKVVSKEAALKNWKNDTGEDLEALFGVNPLSPEVAFTVKADYATQARLDTVAKSIRLNPEVEAVALPDSVMVENMNRNIERFAMILGIIALVMIVISFVLINNTVHLAVYARRFTIHTMQLVGATDGFIRRPFIMSNMLSGLVAGIIAVAIIGVALAVAPGGGFTDVADYVSWEIYAAVGGGLILVGMLLCALAAMIATTRYLHQDYDELFK